MQTELSWVNGVAAYTVSIHNRGLAYGDGVFETILCRGNRPERLAQHLQRLQRGCARLNLDCPDLTSILAEAMAATCEPLSVLKIIVTRAEPAAAYAYRAGASDSIVILKPYRPAPAAQLNVGIATVAVAHNPQLAGIKHLSRLEHVMAAAEAKQKGVDDLLLLDTQDNVIESIHSNAFFMKEGQWYTPNLTNAGVAGVMRQFLLENYFPAAGIECKVTDISADTLHSYEAAFISNSLRGVRPINSINGRVLNTDIVTRQININA